MARDPNESKVRKNEPPKEYQFKPGQSGNPSGRRKAAPTFAMDLADELREPITLHEKGRERKISKQRAFVKTLTALAIKGDIRAINALVACARNFAPEDRTEKVDEFDPEDIEILEKFVQRKRQANGHARGDGDAGTKPAGHRKRK